jgi:hypothetical protein
MLHGTFQEFYKKKVIKSVDQMDNRKIVGDKNERGGIINCKGERFVLYSADELLKGAFIALFNRIEGLSG